MNTYKRHRFPLEAFSNPWPISAAFPSLALLKLAKNSRADILEKLCLKGGLPPGAKLETPDIPGVVDEVDAGDVLQGFGADGLRWVRRVRRVRRVGFGSVLAIAN